MKILLLLGLSIFFIKDIRGEEEAIKRNIKCSQESIDSLVRHLNRLRKHLSEGRGR